MNMNLEEFSTLVLIKKDNHILSSYVKYNGELLDPRSEYRLVKEFKVKKEDIFWKYDCGTQTEAVKFQRKAHLILKLFYNSGVGDLYGIDENTVKTVFELVKKYNDRDSMVKAYNLIYFRKKWNEYQENERGILYFMKDFTEDGKVYFKVGVTNEEKGAEGRLEELKREHYLSEYAMVMDQFLFEKRSWTEYFEGLIHIFLSSNKISSPYRPQAKYGNKEDNFDECFDCDETQINIVRGYLISHNTPEKVIEQFKGNK